MTGPASRGLAGAAALALLGACAPLPAELEAASRVRPRGEDGGARLQALYRCENNQGMLVRFSEEGPVVRVVRGVQELTLVEARSWRGHRYVAPGGWEFWAFSGGAYFTAPGERRTACTDLSA